MRYGVALGSNIGPRKLNLSAAKAIILREIAAPGEDALVASLYETAPVGCESGIRAFYNSCIEFETPLEPHALLERLQDIEYRLGRLPGHTRNAPRTIDLDILYANALVLDTPDLTIPHPELVHRRFVLEPLCDIRPDLVLPSRTETVAELLVSLESNEPPLILVTSNW